MKTYKFTLSDTDLLKLKKYKSVKIGNYIIQVKDDFLTPSIKVFGGGNGKKKNIF